MTLEQLAWVVLLFLFLQVGIDVILIQEIRKLQDHTEQPYTHHKHG